MPGIRRPAGLSRLSSLAKMAFASAMVLLALLVIPLTGLEDSRALNREQVECARLEARLLFDHPLERLFVLKLVVGMGEDGGYLVRAHALGGFEYGAAEVMCGGKARVLWRRW